MKKVFGVDLCMMRTVTVAKAPPSAKPNGHPDSGLFIPRKAHPAVAITENTPFQAVVSRRDVLSQAFCLVVQLNRRGRHVAIAQRSGRRPDLTLDPSRGMPLDSNHILHAWIKHYEHDQSTDKMPTEPDKHDLLGFTGVKAEDPKWYIRRLWLVAENDRKPFPKFLDTDVQELAMQVNKVVTKFAKHEDMRYEELCGGAFLKKDASHILDDLGFGSRVWGEDFGAEIRLKSNLPGSHPRWGVETDSGYKSNDEDR
ncbi:hypothetical protein IG631_23686 [Alternaria alternata]|jgi:hypothetical protein|nr:hypothetical protein IG631_23686 [Alternaria alternata]